jgi:hypothetical protein
MKKIIFTLFFLGFNIAALAGSVVVNEDILIQEPEFSKLIWKAYSHDWQKQADGSSTFSNLLKCKEQKCWLMKGMWTNNQVSSLSRNVIYIPRNDDSVFDLFEYMNVQPEKEQFQGERMFSKKIEYKTQQKSYSLNCINVTRSATGKSKFIQCVLYNGIFQ